MRIDSVFFAAGDFIRLSNSSKEPPATCGLRLSTCCRRPLNSLGKLNLQPFKVFRRHLSGPLALRIVAAHSKQRAARLRSC